MQFGCRCLSFINMYNSNRQKQQEEKIEDIAHFSRANLVGTAVPVMFIAVLRWKIVRNLETATSSIYLQYTLTLKNELFSNFNSKINIISPSNIDSLPCPRREDDCCILMPFRTYLTLLLLVLLSRQFYKLVSFPVMYCWKANMTSLLSYLLECFEPPLLLIFLHLS